MKKYVVCGLWACLYLICACLGFAQEPGGFGLVLCVLMSVAFFVPGALLLYWGYRDQDRNTVKAVRLLCILVLSATMVLLAANFLSVLMPQWVGTALHILLVLVSVPMVCSRFWGLILFFWACLLMATFLKQKK